MALKQSLSPRLFESIRKIHYGTNNPELALRQETLQRASNLNVEVKGFKIHCEEEQTRPARVIKVAAIQNQIVVPPSRPVAEQKRTIFERIKDIIELAAL